MTVWYQPEKDILGLCEIGKNFDWFFMEDMLSATGGVCDRINNKTFKGSVEFPVRLSKVGWVLIGRAD